MLGFISKMALLSNGRMAMETMHEGEGRHWVNSRKEICSTETRLTMT